MTLRLPTRVKPRSPAFSLNIKERQLDKNYPRFIHLYERKKLGRHIIHILGQ